MEEAAAAAVVVVVVGGVETDAGVVVDDCTVGSRCVFARVSKFGS